MDAVCFILLDGPVGPVGFVLRTMSRESSGTIQRTSITITFKEMFNQTSVGASAKFLTDTIVINFTLLQTNIMKKYPLWRIQVSTIAIGNDY